MKSQPVLAWLGDILNCLTPISLASVRYSHSAFIHEYLDFYIIWMLNFVTRDLQQLCAFLCSSPRSGRLWTSGVRPTRLHFSWPNRIQPCWHCCHSAMVHKKHITFMEFFNKCRTPILQSCQERKALWSTIPVQKEKYSQDLQMFKWFKSTNSKHLEFWK